MKDASHTSNKPVWPYEWEPFPTDEMTLTLLESACNINPDTEHSELHRFLDMTAGPIKSVSMNGIEYESVEAALADYEYDTPPILEIEREPGHEPHSEHTVIVSLIAEIRCLRMERDHYVAESIRYRNHWDATLVRWGMSILRRKRAHR